jgi:linoleate 10R-lipoxygenase
MLYSYVYMNFDPANDWHLREDAVKAFEKVDGFLQSHLEESMVDTFRHLGIETYHSHHFLKRAQEANIYASKAELSAFVFAAAVPTAALYSQAIAHIVDFYLDKDKRQARAEIVELAASQDADAAAKIMGYIREALRRSCKNSCYTFSYALCIGINPPVSGVYRTAGKDVPVGPITIHAQERVFASLVDANMDVSVFPSDPSRCSRSSQPAVFGLDPITPVYNRPAEKAGILGLGEHG